MKRCEDCAFLHAKRSYAKFEFYTYFECGHKDAVVEDPIEKRFDRVMSCREARDKFCGKNGKMFEEKNKNV